MEIPVLLSYIFGGTSLVSIALFLIYFKQNKRLKNNEVSQSDTKTQKEQIDLGMQFIESANKAAEIIQQATQNTDSKIDALSQRIETKMTGITRNQTSMNKKLKMMEKYLNGNYQRFSKTYFGAYLTVGVDDKTAVVEGVEQLSGAPVQATDLRAGAALVIAALAAHGESEISYVHYIERGYENIVDKVRALGADIRMVEEADETDTIIANIG